jgi:hypothetical protein
MRVACLGPMSLGAGPLNTLCREPADWRELGLRLDDRVEVAVAEGTELWMPPQPARRDPRAVATGLDRLAAQCERMPIGGGFAALIAPLARGAALSGKGDLARAALPSIEALRRRLASGDLELFLGEALAPIGLGPGLTPAGDDLIGGVMIVLHALCWSAPSASLARQVLQAAEQGTGAVSYAHLRAASQGEGAALLHEAIERMLGGDIVELAGLARLGHSSGWDMLAGAALGARAWLEALGSGDRHKKR